jgi:tetratricopeptide (TPR) repeat protein
MMYFYKLNFQRRTDLRTKEVRMSSKASRTALFVFIASGLIFASSGCGKLKVSRLAANYHFSQGNQYFKHEEYRKAIDYYEKAVASNPNLAEAYQYLGESYKSLYKPGDESAQNKQKADKALGALKKALELFPNNKQIIYSLADMYDKLQNFEESEKLYLRILQMEPTNMGNYYVVAQFYQKYSGGSDEQRKDAEGRAIKTPFQKAEEMYLRRIELDPENPEGYAYAAQFYDNIKPAPIFDKAYAYHKLRLSFDPNNAEVWYAIGVNRFSKAFRLQNVLPYEEKQKCGEESEKALKKAIEIDANYANAYYYINILYRNVYVGLYPEKEDLYIAEADRWQERGQELAKRAAERKRLEDELRGKK